MIYLRGEREGAKRSGAGRGGKEGQKGKQTSLKCSTIWDKNESRYILVELVKKVILKFKFCENFNNRR